MNLSALRPFLKISLIRFRRFRQQTDHIAEAKSRPIPHTKLCIKTKRWSLMKYLLAFFVLNEVNSQDDTLLSYAYWRTHTNMEINKCTKSNCATFIIMMHKGNVCSLSRSKFSLCTILHFSMWFSVFFYLDCSI